MSSSKVFSEQAVIETAEQIRNATKRYEQLFVDLQSQISLDIKDLDSPVQIMSVCRKWTDDALIFFSNNFPLHRKTDCEKGCSHCCSLPVTCPPQVIADIATYLKNTLSRRELTQLQQLLQKYVLKQESSQHRLKCPFLNQHDLCSIYEYRPLACRSFTSPDQQLCLASVRDGNTVTQDPVQHRIFMAATSALVNLCKQNGLPYQQVKFIPSLANVLE